MREASRNSSVFSLRLSCEHIKVSVQDEPQTKRDKRTPGAYDEYHDAKQIKVHDGETCTSERANQRSDKETRQGAGDHFTLPKGEGFIPARLVVTASALNLLVSQTARGPSHLYPPGRIFNIENAPRFAEADAPE